MTKCFCLQMSHNVTNNIITWPEQANAHYLYKSAQFVSQKASLCSVFTRSPLLEYLEYNIITVFPQILKVQTAVPPGIIGLKSVPHMENTPHSCCFLD